MTRDPATGLPNRLALAARLKTLLEAEDKAEPVALLLVSVEGLRGLAEQHGATAAKKTLGKLSTLFRKSIKKSDFVARVGGQEFAFLCSDVTEENAEAIAQRIRQSVEALRVALPGRAFTTETLSLSAGIATAQPMATPTEFMHQAELALAAARTGSRSGILAYTAELGGKRAKIYSPHAA
ncbi:putative diguanylate cyclase YcdT [compost metagenome]